jgi:hypothetical protein
MPMGGKQLQKWKDARLLDISNVFDKLVNSNFVKRETKNFFYSLDAAKQAYAK